MNHDVLFQAIGEIDSAYIEEYAEYRAKRRKRWPAPAAAAALMAVTVPLCAYAALHREHAAPDAPGVTEPFSAGAPSGGHKAYPYGDNQIQTDPGRLPDSVREEGTIVYHPLAGTEPEQSDLYGALCDAGALKRDFFPIFNADGSVSFSRSSDPNDPDAARYAELHAYSGGRAERLISCLNGLQQTESGPQCVLFQNGVNPNTTAVGMRWQFFSSASMSLVLSQDFGAAAPAAVGDTVDQLAALLGTEGESVLGGQAAAIGYVRQLRGNDEKQTTEERYIYYAFFECERFQYLMQFTSEYTLPGESRDSYGASRKSQQICRGVFEDGLAAVCAFLNA